MRGALVAMMLVAACGGAGVDLDITFDEPFDSVEVFIGNDRCVTIDPATQQEVDCPGVAWKTGMVRASGDVYVMKGDEKIVSIDNVKGSHATMHLEATEDFREPKLIAVVAFSGDTAVAFSMLWGVRIPANTAEHWNIELQKASPANDAIRQAPPATGPDKRVHAWARERADNPATLSRCLAMQIWDNDDKIWNSTYIVPETDHDCDGQTIECDPLYADFNVNGSSHACVMQAPNITQKPCAVGASQCADGISATPACMLPIDGGLTCIPEQSCVKCAGVGDAVSCLVSEFASVTDPALSTFKCTFHATDGGADCSTEQAANSTQLYVPVACSEVEVRDAMTPLSTSGSSSSVSIGNPGQASVAVTVAATTGSSCLVTLYWNDGTIDPLAPPRKTFMLIVKSATTNNTLAFPVHLDWGTPIGVCDTSGTVTHDTCVPQGGNVQQDTMFQCLR